MSNKTHRVEVNGSTEMAIMYKKQEEGSNDSDTNAAIVLEIVD